MRVAILNIGGLVAVGFDATGQFMLTISHSGRGVYDTVTWQRVARDGSLAYPSDGVAIGIGPIDVERIPITEINYDSGTLQLRGPKGDFTVSYECGIAIVASTKPDQLITECLG